MDNSIWLNAENVLFLCDKLLCFSFIELGGDKIFFYAKLPFIAKKTHHYKCTTKNGYKWLWFLFILSTAKRCIQWKSSSKSVNTLIIICMIQLKWKNKHEPTNNDNDNKKWPGKSKRWFCKSSIILISCRAVARWHFWHEKSTLKRMLRRQTMTYYGWHKIIHHFFVIFVRFVLVFVLILSSSVENKCFIDWTIYIVSSRHWKLNEA